MSSFAIGLVLVLLVTVFTVLGGVLSHRLAARIDGGAAGLRSGRVARELVPDATAPVARLHRPAAAPGADAEQEALRRVTVLESEAEALRELTFVGLR
ncbi:hypothetical protein [Brachybacterium hainanense]|uniref:Uncharacterized protein n=1 Tax=Brachybacterium hainanense TaxID=1541174 RepID=A0ABV6R9H6_9MICO